MKFSVVMCVYGKDNPNYFKEALLSIFEQTILPNEIVLVVDGPIPEEIENVIKWAKDQFEDFKVIYLEQNKGHGEARRCGLEACRFEYVAIMDADDICIKERFEKQIDYINKHPNISVVGGQIEEFCDAQTNIVGKRIVPLEHDDICEYLKSRCPFNQMTVMLNKKDVNGAGGYLDWYCDEDYYLWIRMYLAHAQFANLNNTLVKVRVGKEMYARRGGRAYYKSEKNLFKYMYKHKIISWFGYQKAKLVRFIVQVLMTNKMRQWFFKKFARNQV